MHIVAVDAGTLVGGGAEVDEAETDVKIEIPSIHEVLRYGASVFAGYALDPTAVW